MDDAKIQTAQSLGLNMTGNQYAAARENAKTIIANMVKLHERELAAWNYLQLVTIEHPPTEAEEAALWELVCRARRERY